MSWKIKVRYLKSIAALYNETFVDHVAAA